MRDRLLLGVARFSPVITQPIRTVEVVRVKESLQERGLLFLKQSEHPFQALSPLDVRLKKALYNPYIRAVPVSFDLN